MAILRPSVQSFFGLFEISLKTHGFLADIRLRAPGLNAGTNVADAVRHSVSEVATRIRQGQDMRAALLAKGACFSGLVGGERAANAPAMAQHALPVCAALPNRLRRARNLRRPP